MATKSTHAPRAVLEVHLDAPELGAAAHIGSLFPAAERVDLAPSFEYTKEQADRERLSDRYYTYRVSRFDREQAGTGNGQARRMYASAMTLLERHDGQEGASYLDLVEALEVTGGSGLTEDLRQLFRRAVFNLMMGNRDDHLRNHGFLLTRSGWRLAPAFDINPNPTKGEHTLTWDGSSAAPSLPVLMATAPHYRIDATEAQAIVDQVAVVVSTWKERAAKLDLPRVEVQMMANVFAV